MSSVCTRATEEDRIVGTYADDSEMTHKWMDAGVQYVAVTVDGAIFTHTVEDVVESVRE